MYAESNGPLTYDEYVTLLTIDWAAIFWIVQMIMQANSCNRQDKERQNFLSVLFSRQTRQSSSNIRSNVVSHLLVRT